MVKVEESLIVHIGGKVKFPRGEVVYSGNMAIAFNMVAKEYLQSLKNLPDSDLISSGNSAQIGSSGDYAQIGSSGYYAQIGSSGDYARIGSSGDYAQIGSSGDYAQIGSSGYYARIGSSGDYAQIGSSGYYAQIGSSGYYARIDSTGENAVIACAGSVEKFRVGKGGCITVPYNDGNRIRFAVGYEGENIKADVWYCLDELGNFIEL